MSETHDPWKAVGLELLKLKDTRTIEALLRVINEAQAAEAAQHQQEIAAKDDVINKLTQRLVWQIGDASELASLGNQIQDWTRIDAANNSGDGWGSRYKKAERANELMHSLSARLAAVEAERDRLQRVNECVYEVCGCGNMADAHCMICCRPLTEHRLIPTRELAEIQRRFALYAEDLAERDRLKAALSTAAFALDLAGFRRDRDAAYAALTPQGQSTDGETR